MLGDDRNQFSKNIQRNWFAKEFLQIALEGYKLRFFIKSLITDSFI
jgi:hypothetical protein